ncbi:hypothetical protein HBH53_014630 [Parastagonospora nodorum]|nr:hypothetical protein HBH53_014630 [Parastagonospora nodorum]
MHPANVFCPVCCFVLSVFSRNILAVALTRVYMANGFDKGSVWLEIDASMLTSLVVERSLPTSDGSITSERHTPPQQATSLYPLSTPMIQNGITSTPNQAIRNDVDRDLRGAIQFRLLSTGHRWFRGEC